MRALNKLTTTRIKNSSPGKYSDGGGLWLHLRPDGGGQWFLRVTVHGRRREMGLGRFDSKGEFGVSLKEAREKAAKWRAVARQGKDPIKVREKQKREAAKADHTLDTIAQEAFEARKAELRDDGKAGRWFTPLKLYVLPKLGNVPVEDIDQRDVKNALAPIWHEKADTAQKALNRLRITLRYAAAMGLDVDMQATEKARELLGKTRHVIQNIPSMPWQEVPAFYETLNKGTIAHLALRLLILTNLRSKPIRFCRLDQIDGDVWTVPAENMKALKGNEADFRVPLSKEALNVIEQAKPLARDGFLFPSQRRGVTSDATMSRLMERRELEFRPHGFRSSFRTWCAEATDAPEQVAETALAHVTGSKVERAYRRTDFLEQRRVLMERWADHVTGGSGEVVRMVR
ncbi:integrase arm-type DNA-binding domain-containing protein [Roseovarius sp. CAU 1744]|uniref:tyrosine-type recombinase/integrase n=1 Tax=Roseovarius sp. CAU 1744 TaxID=3140368 RepID=UPI00325BD4C1